MLGLMCFIPDKVLSHVDWCQCVELHFPLWAVKVGGTEAQSQLCLLLPGAQLHPLVKPESVTCGSFLGHLQERGTQ